MKKPFNENVLDKNLFSFDLMYSPVEALLLLNIIAHCYNIKLIDLYKRVQPVTYNNIVFAISGEFENKKKEIEKNGII